MQLMNSRSALPKQQQLNVARCNESEGEKSAAMEGDLIEYALRRGATKGTLYVNRYPKPRRVIHILRKYAQTPSPRKITSSGRDK